MSLLEPNQDDQDPNKQPRFRQDMVAFLVMGIAGIGYIVYLLIWG